MSTLYVGSSSRAKLIHRASLIRSDGSVSAKCFAKPKPIDLKRATWTNRDEAVTCPKCRAAMLAARERER
jgi:hypothetical protein